jgi:orotidine-5'-phosphate decarboxylase
VGSGTLQTSENVDIKRDFGAMSASALAVAGVRPDPIEFRDRLIVALDVPNDRRAFELVEKLGDTVLFYKIGLQLQFAGGLQVAETLIKRGKKIFLDSKICDIDETVKGAVANVADMGVDFVTVHGNGASIRAAVEGRGKHPLKILSVTLLTSLDAHDMKDLGLAAKYTIPDIVLMRAKNALEAGCDGVIASGKEAAEIRKMAGSRLLIVTPGIRSKNVPHHDQKRVATPYEAITAGADYLVMGRQIIESENPKKMVESVFKEIEAALSQ